MCSQIRITLQIVRACKLPAICRKYISSDDNLFINLYYRTMPVLHTWTLAPILMHLSCANSSCLRNRLADSTYAHGSQREQMKCRIKNVELIQQQPYCILLHIFNLFVELGVYIYTKTFGLCVHALIQWSYLAAIPQLETMLDNFRLFFRL